MFNFDDLKNKHIIVTGASSGIGRETAIILSKLGAKVALISSSEEKLKETVTFMDGEGHSVHAVNLSQIDLIEGIIKEIIAVHGPVDGFVHSAGIVKNLPIVNYTYERLDAIMKVNFYSFMEIIRLISKKKNHNTELSIVGVSSVAAVSGASTQAAYGASKAAMNGAMRCLAKELGTKGVRVNTVLPAATNTAMYREFKELKADMTDTKMEMSASSRQYLGMNEPSDVARAIIFLLSTNAKMITGVELPVDGGYTSC